MNLQVLVRKSIPRLREILQSWMNFVSSLWLPNHCSKWKWPGKTQFRQAWNCCIELPHCLLFYFTFPAASSLVGWHAWPVISPVLFSIQWKRNGILGSEKACVDFFVKLSFELKWNVRGSEACSIEYRLPISSEN